MELLICPRQRITRKSGITTQTKVLMQKMQLLLLHKIGKKIDDYYVTTKALQPTSLSFREIERIIE
jgi:hypothetical protein